MDHLPCLHPCLRHCLCKSVALEGDNVLDHLPTGIDNRPHGLVVESLQVHVCITDQGGNQAVLLPRGVCGRLGDLAEILSSLECRSAICILFLIGVAVEGVRNQSQVPECPLFCRQGLKLLLELVSLRLQLLPDGTKEAEGWMDQLFLRGHIEIGLIVLLDGHDVICIFVHLGIIWEGIHLSIHLCQVLSANLCLLFLNGRRELQGIVQVTGKGLLVRLGVELGSLFRCEVRDDLLTQNQFGSLDSQTLLKQLFDDGLPSSPAQKVESLLGALQHRNEGLLRLSQEFHTLILRKSALPDFLLMTGHHRLCHLRALRPRGPLSSFFIEEVKRLVEIHTQRLQEHHRPQLLSGSVVHYCGKPTVVDVGDNHLASVGHSIGNGGRGHRGGQQIDHLYDALLGGEGCHIGLEVL
mmetsp:Transcript_28701/g.56208  ORF Transcript_28701/g.56208 Transcript_28701/m.56208 type:complete len:410 (+) Transcript_28701:4007-5236(+)